MQSASTIANSKSTVWQSVGVYYYGYYYTPGGSHADSV